MKVKTFKEARVEMLDYLASHGWRLSDRTLKVPHATSPNGNARLWFKAQAVYVSFGNHHTLNDARSLFSDIRVLTPEQLVTRAK